MTTGGADVVRLGCSPTPVCPSAMTTGGADVCPSAMTLAEHNAQEYARCLRMAASYRLDFPGLLAEVFPRVLPQGDVIVTIGCGFGRKPQKAYVRKRKSEPSGSLII